MRLAMCLVNATGGSQPRRAHKSRGANELVGRCSDAVLREGDDCRGQSKQASEGCIALPRAGMWGPPHEPRRERIFRTKCGTLLLAPSPHQRTSSL